MAISLSKTRNDFDNLTGGDANGYYVVEGTATLNTYATNGVAIATSDIDADCSAITHLFCDMSTDGLNRHRYDASAGKIVATVEATDTEVANSTDLSAAAKQFYFRAVCT